MTPATDKPVPADDARPDEMNPAVVARCWDPKWRYSGEDATDVRRTWARFGWSPLPNLRRGA